MEKNKKTEFIEFQLCWSINEPMIVITVFRFLGFTHSALECIKLHSDIISLDYM